MKGTFTETFGYFQLCLFPADDQDERFCAVLREVASGRGRIVLKADDGSTATWRPGAIDEQHAKGESRD